MKALYLSLVLGTLVFAATIYLAHELSEFNSQVSSELVKSMVTR